MIYRVMIYEYVLIIDMHKSSINNFDEAMSFRNGKLVMGEGYKESRHLDAHSET